MPPAKIGLALSIIGIIGISIQLLLYPRLSARLGTALSYQLSLLLFPITYFMEILRGIILRGAVASDLVPWMAGLACCTVSILAVSAWRFRKTLD